MRKGISQTLTANLGKEVFYVFCFLILTFLNSPIFIIMPISLSSAKFLTFPPPGFSLQWYSNFFGRSDWTGAMWLSFKVAIIVMVFSTFLGTLASFGIVRGNFRGKKLIYSFIISPLIMPIIIVGLASYFLLAKLGLVGSQFGLSLIHTTIAVPLVVVIVSNTLKTFDITLEKAAMIMGANPIRTFFKVTLPQIRTGLFSAAFFSFLVSFDELIIVLFVGGVSLVTLPRRMWTGIRDEIDPTIAAVASLLTLLSLCILGMIMIFHMISERKGK